MAAAYLIINERRLLRRERLFRDRNNPLDYMDDREIISKFRLPRHLILDICQMIQNDITRPTRRICGFPNVIGAIDGTHVGIKSPSFEEHVFVNRKNYHSINTMAVCDAKLKFINIVAKWPGSSHDSFVWNNSTLCQLFENKNIPRGWLLGDSGYPLRSFLLTPVMNPTTPKENAYNTAHIKTRNVIERCFGVWKMRFRCMDTSGGTLQFSPKRTCNIIVATAVLHNICVENRVPEPQGRPVINDGNDCVYHGTLNDGNDNRRQLIEARF
ncbi:putative nuclease HARBI1 [Saccostrea cucullata]|uniref:putative nuclease HARBI1 n=1 Tax=Saccostrea cuccullata TaxID=36930 RepID=UPI002ED5AD73